jgi:hypothetical protein
MTVSLFLNVPADNLTMQVPAVNFPHMSNAEDIDIIFIYIA